MAKMIQCKSFSKPDFRAERSITGGRPSFFMAFCHKYGIFKSFAIPLKVLILMGFCSQGGGAYGKYGKNSISLLFGVREKYNNDKREVKTFAMFAIHAIAARDPTVISTVRKRNDNRNDGVGIPSSLINADGSLWAIAPSPLRLHPA